VTRSLALTLLALVATGAAAAPVCEPAAIHLVRHAEKAAAVAGDADVTLSEVGQRRAAALAAQFDGRPLDAIYATHLRRTQHTAAPLAAARGLEIRVLPAADTAALVARLRERHCGEHVLAVGHSNTVPEIAAALGVAAPVIGEDDFGVIYRLETGSGALQQETFGEPAR
jgi:phosphohistidine phosphatase SixA